MISFESRSEFDSQSWEGISLLLSACVHICVLFIDCAFQLQKNSNMIHQFHHLQITIGHSFASKKPWRRQVVVREDIC